MLVVDGRVSARLNSASLASALRDIADQARLEIVILGGQSDERVTASFENLPIDVAIGILIRGNGGGAFVFEETAAGGRRLVGAYVTIAPGGPGIRDGAGISAHGPPGPSGAPAPAAAGPSRAVPTASGPAAIAAAEEALRAGSIEDFVPAAIALYPGVKKPVDAVYAAATEHPDANVRLNALSVMAEVGSGEEARRALERAANDPDPTVQARARQMLGRPGAAGASPIGRRGR